MSLNDEPFPTSDSFWEIGKYMRTVKRIDNGHKLCDQLRQLIEQRAEIEKSYSKKLTGWADKWNDFLDKGPEYGSTQASWRGVLQESKEISGLHTTIADRLMSDVYTPIKGWQKENYTKSRMMHFKQTKESEDGFRKAQKPWEKKYNKVCLARKDYHNACKSEKSTANQENNAKGDGSVAPEQIKKLQEKLRKLSEDVQNSKRTYEACLSDLNTANPKYMEEMTLEFTKCQDIEEVRIDFFKKTMFDIHRCMDLSVEPKFSRIYTDLHSTISSIDADSDLKWWSNNHGTDMAMNWPQFEEYSPELNLITKKSKYRTAGEDGIMVKSIKRDPTYLANTEPAYNTDHTNTYTTTARTQPKTPTTTDVQSIIRVESPDMQNGKNPFGGDDTESDEERQESAVRVRALYDYDKADSDELDLKTGDVFEKLANEDDMGWAKGKKNGIIGLYPAHYVEEVSN